MDDDLIDSGLLPLSRKSLLPGTGFFYPDSLDEDRADERVAEAVDGAEAVVVADLDADGLGCAALIREMYDAALDPEPFLADIESRMDDDPIEEVVEDDEEDEDETPDSSVALVGASPHNVEDALERVAEYADDGVEVYVCDLCPDKYEYVEEALESLVAHADSVHWFDHHQWNDDVAAAVREAGVDLVVGDSDEECTTDVALRSLDYEFSEHFEELAAVTRDHDLWIRADERSDDLADYAYWVQNEEYVAVVGRYGADLPEEALAYVEHRRIEKEKLIDLAVSRAEFKRVGEWTVGVTYGRCSQNEVAETLREQGADAAVIVKPAGSASIRGSEGFERAHEVAAYVDGGGHPRAAGCKPEIYDDMLDYANHWSTQGSAAKRVILAAFERVAETAEEEDEKDAEDEGVETER